jgi:MFS family permease
MDLPTSEVAPTPAPARTGQEVERLRDLSPQQRKSGLAAWLGWTFDGLDMHLYTLVATPFVAELLRVTDTTDPRVGKYTSIIQASFLLGWALGGGFFGRIGDRLGRSRALCLTIMTYAAFTGLSVFAQEWWHLMIFRFMAALGIGGEWAVGAALLAETWPKKWRPWMAAVLQTGVNIGVLAAILANVVMRKQPPRYVFLIGVVPALLVLWIRRAVPETEEWHRAKKGAPAALPGIADLFRGAVLKTTLWTMAACSISLTAHWAFLFWHVQHLRNLPEVLLMSDAGRNDLVNKALYLVMVASIGGNFFAAWLSRRIGYRQTIVWLCLGYFLTMYCAYSVPRDHASVLRWLPMVGFFQGLFALYTMYLPPLFPTLLRTTGAGFCYNIGRIAAAFGTVFFGIFSKGGDHRLDLLYAAFLFLPAALVACFLPKPVE